MKMRWSWRAAVLAAVGASLVGRPRAGLGQDDRSVGGVLGMRSPGAALGVSVAGMAIPTLMGLTLSDGGGAGPWLVLGGLVAGPSLGDLYAGSGGRAAEGILGRAAVVGLTIVAVQGICAGDACGLFSSDDGALAFAGMVALVGVATTVVLGVHEIVTTDDRVRARNARLTGSITLVPMVDPVRRGAGLVLGVRF